MHLSDYTLFPEGFLLHPAGSSGDGSLETFSKSWLLWCVCAWCPPAPVSVWTHRLLLLSAVVSRRSAALMCGLAGGALTQEKCHIHVCITSTFNFVQTQVQKNLTGFGFVLVFDWAMFWSFFTSPLWFLLCDHLTWVMFKTALKRQRHHRTTTVQDLQELHRQKLLLGDANYVDSSLREYWKCEFCL